MCSNLSLNAFSCSLCPLACQELHNLFHECVVFTEDVWHALCFFYMGVVHRCAFSVWELCTGADIEAEK